MKYKKLIIAGIAISIFLPTIVFAQNSSLWALISSKLKPVVATWGLQIPSLGSVGNPCVTVGTTGIFATSSCPGGMGTSTNPFMASYFVATSTATTTFAGGVDISGILRVRQGILGDMTLNATGNATIGGTLGVTGASTLTGAVISSNIAALTTSAESWIGPSNTTGIYFKGGLVGIGLSNPAYTLDIKGQAGSVSPFNVASSTGASFMTITTAGNVGMGISVPQDGLSVSRSTGGTFSVGTNGYTGTTASPLNTAMLFRGYIDNVLAKISSYDQSGTVAAGGGLHFFTSSNLAVADASTEKMTILANGNVGIGTTSPAVKLDVWGAVRSSVTGASVSYTALNPGNGYPRGQMLIDYNNSAPVNVGFSVAPAYGNNSQFYQTSLAVENNKVGTNSGYRTAGISQGIGFASIYAVGGSLGNGAGDPLKFSTQTYLGNNSGLVINNDTNQTVNIGTDILSTINQLNVVPRNTLNAAYFGGKVGLGTTTPNAMLDIFQTVGGSAPLFSIASSTNGAGTTTAFTVLGNGNVGIGTTSPATKLDVNGTITQLTVKSCSLGLTTDALGSITGCVASDEKLKTNITQITGGDAILELNPVLYQWKDKTKDNGMVHSGFVAQQVEKVMPEAVVNAGMDTKGVDSNSILSYTVKFIQDFYASFQKLVARVSGLEQKLNAQQKQIDAMQLQINNLTK